MFPATRVAAATEPPAHNSAEIAAILVGDGSPSIVRLQAARIQRKAALEEAQGVEFGLTATS